MSDSSDAITFPALERPIRLGFLISGGGRTLVNIADRIESRGLGAAIELVVASRETIPGVSRARERGLDVRVINAETDGPRASADAAINRAFAEAGVDLICMGGYMKYFVVGERFAHRVINIHPALLPSFGGKGMFGDRVHAAVLAHGCKVSGCTVHFVDEEYDHGPIIVQKTCEVREDDTVESLAARVFALECEAYPEAIALIAAGRVAIEGRCVRIASNPAET